jgi:hypothetical protein
VVTPDLTQSFEKTNTVSNPVSKKAHHAQLPLSPSLRIISVKRFALFVLVVAATIDTPISHHGIEPADLKYSFAPFDLDLIAEITGIRSITAKNAAITM